MKINKNSWHYKINNLGHGYERSNDNLCRYFWRLISKIVFIIIGIPLLVVGLGYLGYTICSEPLVLILILFVISATTLPAMAIGFIRKKLGKSPEIPYENIVTEYIKAKKEKVCPLIEYI